MGDVADEQGASAGVVMQWAWGFCVDGVGPSGRGRCEEGGVVDHREVLGVGVLTVA